jgi:hypothetical protein
MQYFVPQNSLQPIVIIGLLFLKKDDLKMIVLGLLFGLIGHFGGRHLQVDTTIWLSTSHKRADHLRENRHPAFFSKKKHGRETGRGMAEMKRPGMTPISPSALFRSGDVGICRMG